LDHDEGVEARLPLYLRAEAVVVVRVANRDRVILVVDVLRDVLVRLDTRLTRQRQRLRVHLRYHRIADRRVACRAGVVRRDRGRVVHQLVAVRVRDDRPSGRVDLAITLVGAPDLGVRGGLETTDLGVGQTDLFQALHNRLGGVFEADHVRPTY